MKKKILLAVLSLCMCCSLTSVDINAKSKHKNHKIRYSINQTEINNAHKNLIHGKHILNEQNVEKDAKEINQSFQNCFNNVSYEKKQETVNYTLNAYFNQVEEYNDSGRSFTEDDSTDYIIESFINENNDKIIRMYSKNYDILYYVSLSDSQFTYSDMYYDYATDSYLKYETIVYEDMNKEVEDEFFMQSWGNKGSTNSIFGPIYWLQIDTSNSSKVRICHNGELYQINNINANSTIKKNWNDLYSGMATVASEWSLTLSSLHQPITEGLKSIVIYSFTHFIKEHENLVKFVEFIVAAYVSIALGYVKTCRDHALSAWNAYTNLSYKFYNVKIYGTRC